MKVFTCTDHRGHFPVGTASVVVAENCAEAWRLLADALDERGLGDDEFTLTELPTDTPLAIVLRDGDY